MTKIPNPITTKAEAVEVIRRFIAQRSGIEAGNYVSDWRDTEGRKALNADRYTIAQHGRDARTLLAAVEARDGITLEAIANEMTTRDRLTLDFQRGALEYTTGQYFPTEYRAAVCRALANVLWHYYAEGLNGPDGKADRIRKTARNVFGRGIASRWFN